MAKYMFRSNPVHKIAGVFFVLFLFLAASSSGQEKAKFPISVASKTVGFVPVWVAWRMGYFDREGLAVDLVLMRGAEKAAMALVGESVNVAVGSADAFISAVESNFNVAITAGIINRPSFFIMAKKNYKTFQDLRGATIGVTNISSGPAVALRYVLKAKGLEYPQRLQAATRGSGRRAHHGHERGAHRRIASGCTFQLRRGGIGLPRSGLLSRSDS